MNLGALILSGLLGFSFLMVPQDLQRNQRANFVVLGNCTMCKDRIETSVLNLSGVKYGSWNIETKYFKTIFNQKKINLQEIHNAIAKSGHDTPLAKAKDSIYQALPLCCLYKRKDIREPLSHQNQ